MILAAGAVGTPVILQRSGVGDAALLGALGVDPVADLPGVVLEAVHWAAMSPAATTVKAPVGGSVVPVVP
ncbi:hypothetical protein ACWCQ0_49315 [Streptomyces massasporeus]